MIILALVVTCYGIQHVNVMCAAYACNQITGMKWVCIDSFFTCDPTVVRAIYHYVRLILYVRLSDGCSRQLLLWAPLHL